MSTPQLETFERKSVHISLPKIVHRNFRIFCIENSLSMQEIFCDLASLIVDEDPVLLRQIDQLIERKSRPTTAVLPKNDIDKIFEAIQNDNTPSITNTD